MSTVCVYGAGNIGCYVGGRLAAAGADVVFIGRERNRAEIATHGLRLTDLDGSDVRVGQVRFETDPDAAKDAGLVLVTVKSEATAAVGSTLAGVLPSTAVVVSFQNGVSNAAVLREHLSQRVLAGMVPFNVARRGDGWLHQGSEGDLEVASDPSLEPFLGFFDAAGLPLQQHADIDAVLWAKLMLNLNNPINALSGLPLKEELSQRGYREVLSLAQRELLAVGAACGRHAAKLTPLPPSWVPHLLRLPDVVFRSVAQSMLAIDPVARSSMWDDLELGRTTEIDWISGEVVRLGLETGVPTPVNQALIRLIRDAEQGVRRDWTAAELLRLVKQ